MFEMGILMYEYDTGLSDCMMYDLGILMYGYDTGLSLDDICYGYVGMFDVWLC